MLKEILKEAGKLFVAEVCRELAKDEDKAVSNLGKIVYHGFRLDEAERRANKLPEPEAYREVRYV